MIRQKSLRKSSKGFKEVKSFLDQWEKMKNAYFWSPPQSASSRRNYEGWNSDAIKIMIAGILYEGKIDVSCSCKHIYVSRVLKVDGEVKRITALKKLVG